MFQLEKSTILSYKDSVDHNLFMQAFLKGEIEIHVQENAIVRTHKFEEFIPQLQGKKPLNQISNIFKSAFSKKYSGLRLEHLSLILCSFFSSHKKNSSYASVVYSVEEIIALLSLISFDPLIEFENEQGPFLRDAYNKLVYELIKDNESVLSFVFLPGWKVEVDGREIKELSVSSAIEILKVNNHALKAFYSERQIPKPQSSVTSEFIFATEPPRDGGGRIQYSAKGNGKIEKNLGVFGSSEYQSLDYIKWPIPSRSSSYIGQDENMGKLISFIDSHESHVALVYGIGGIGKTELVAKAFEKKRLKNVIYWKCFKDQDRLSFLELAERLDMLISDHNSEHRLITQIIRKIKSIQSYVVIDDIHNIFSQRRFIEELLSLNRGKVVLIGREKPAELLSTPLEKSAIIHLDFLQFKELKKFVDSKTKIIHPSIHLIRDEVVSIYSKIGGHPEVCNFVLQLLSEGAKLEDVLKDLPQLIEGLQYKYISDNLLNKLFESNDSRESQLLCEISTFARTVQLKTLSRLQTYDERSFRSLKDKNFIHIHNGLVSVPDMIKEFAYAKVKDPQTVHLKIANALLEEFEKLEKINPILVMNILYHSEESDSEEVIESFKNIFQENFPETRTRDFLSSDIKSSLDVYEAMINIYPRNVKYHSKRSKLYRRMKNFKLGYEKLKESLSIPEFHNDEYLLLEKVIYQKRLKEIDGVKRTLEKIFEQNQNSVYGLHAEMIFKFESNDVEGAVKNAHELIRITERKGDLSTIPKLLEFMKKLIKRKEFASFEELMYLSIESNDFTSIILFYNLAKELVKRNQLKLARGILEKLLKVTRTDRLLSKIGFVYLEMGEIESAHSAFAESIYLNKSNISAYVGKAKTHLKQGQQKVAHDLFLNALEIDQSVPLRNEYSKFLLECNETGKAIDEYLKTIELYPSNPRPLLELATIYFSYGNYRKVVNVISKSRLVDNNVHLLGLLTQSYFELNNFDLAFEKAQKVLSKEKYNIPINILLAEYYGKNELDDLAIKHYKLGLKSKGSREVIRVKYGRFLWKKGEHATALNMFNQAIVENPSSSFAYGVRGRFYSTKRDAFDKAESDLLRAIEIDGKDPSLQLSLGKLYSQKKEFQNKALDLFNGIIDSNPNSPHPQATVEKAMTLVLLKQVPEAIQVLQDFLTNVDDTNRYALNVLGSIYFKTLKDFDMAISYFERSLANKSDVTCREYLLQIYQAKNNEQTAMKFAFELLGINPKNTMALTFFAKVNMSKKSFRKALILLEVAFSNRSVFRDSVLRDKLLKLYKKLGLTQKYNDLYLETNELLKKKKLKRAYLFKAKKHYLLVDSAQRRTLVKKDKIGLVVIIDGEPMIRGKSMLDQNWKGVSVAANISDGDEVYYSLFKTRTGQLEVDFIEPYFSKDRYVSTFVNKL
jgi:tetratricopeptide (TPR) repeat protein